MRLYVGNFPYSVTEQDLRSIFREYGEVHSVSLVWNPGENRHKGFAFVEMDDGDGERARIGLHGADWGGRTLKVDVARPREPRTGKPIPRGEAVQG